MKANVLIYSLLISEFVCSANAQTTKFNYQGSFRTSGSPANGSFDFDFALFDDISEGSQDGSVLTRPAVAAAKCAFAVSVPCGLSSDGLPIGAQLVGNFWSEDTLLNMTHAYETAFPLDAKPFIFAD